MQILLTSPDHDVITRYMRIWSERLVMENKTGAKFFRLDKRRASRRNVESFLKKKPLDFLIINGHGADDRIGGHDNEIILDEDNIGLCCGKQIHALSCKTAQKLGKLAMQQGAVSYVGYDENFILVYDKSKVSHPEKDATAKLFLDAAFVAPRAMIGGQSADEAVLAAKKEYNRSIMKAFNSDIQSDDDQFIRQLIWNRNHLKSVKPED